MIVEPMTLAGTIIGVVLNKILPAWLTTALLVLVLSWASWRMFLKGRELWAKECTAQVALMHKNPAEL